MIEYWFEDSNNFFSGRLDDSMNSRLKSMELEFLASSFYREVDETVAVIPNRDWPPDFITDEARQKLFELTRSKYLD